MSLKLIYHTKQKLQKLQIKNTTFRYEYKSLRGNVLSNLNFKTTFLPTNGRNGMQKEKDIEQTNTNQTHFKC